MASLQGKVGGSRWANGHAAQWALQDLGVQSLEPLVCEVYTQMFRCGIWIDKGSNSTPHALRFLQNCIQAESKAFTAAMQGMLVGALHSGGQESARPFHSWPQESLQEASPTWDCGEVHGDSRVDRGTAGTTGH